MELYESDKTTLKASSSSVGSKNISALAEAGTYYIKIFSNSMTYDEDQTYKLTALFGPSCFSLPLSNQSSHTITTSACASPLTPSNITATDGIYSNKVSIIWDDSYGADSYRVYRCTTDTTSSCSVFYTDSSPPFDDTGVIAGTIYYYRVKACNSEGCSDFSIADSGFRATATSNPPTVNITVSPSSITAGNSTSISWSTANASSCSASGGWAGIKDTSGNETLSPGATVTYTLTCSGTGGTDSDSTTVIVEGTSNPPIVLIDATPKTVESGGQAYLVWASANSTSCNASGGWSGPQDITGYEDVYPTSTTEYTITCTGPEGSDDDSVTINVGSLGEVNLEATPSTIFDGGESTLTWTTQGMSSCEASGDWSGSKSLNDTKTVSPSSDSTYTLTCIESGGTPTPLIQNGGFTGSTSEWTKTGDFYADDEGEFYGNAPGYAYLAGSNKNLATSNNLEGELYQNVTLPGDASSIELEYWVSVATNEITTTHDYDALITWIQNSSGTSSLALVSTRSNLDEGGYEKVTYDLSSFAGQSIRLYFEGTTDETLGTIFRIDDVSIEAVIPSEFSDSAEITVLDPPSPTLTFDASPDSINLGDSSTLS